ncbi:hypothetical protein [Deinococcus altitudinis]|uniref:hypothetical protein n=1 Tax=Deinococcus altitudinis TaxID=468914 RepID=UPI0038917E35
MTPEELRLVVARLPSRLPLTDELEGRLPGEIAVKKKAWYSTQKQHLMGWLGEYAQKGAYGRQGLDHDARHMYTHFQCAPGLLWLAEGVGVPHHLLIQGVEAIHSAGPSGRTQSAAFRRVVGWNEVEAAIREKLGA